MKSQNNQILSDLKKGKKITPLDALRDYDCFRLGARAKDLRNMGYEVITTMVKRNGKRFAEYSL